MTNENKMKAIEICMKNRATVEFHPVIKKMVYEQYLGLTYACPMVINNLVEAGFSLSMNDGHIIIDKY